MLTNRTTGVKRNNVVAIHDRYGSGVSTPKPPLPPKAMELYNRHCEEMMILYSRWPKALKDEKRALWSKMANRHADEADILEEDAEDVVRPRCK